MFTISLRAGLKQHPGRWPGRSVITRFSLFSLPAQATRLTFWFYTGRVWEDALVTITAARNVWEGFGLTHHASEPHVQSFTSRSAFSFLW